MPGGSPDASWGDTVWVFNHMGTVSLRCHFSVLLVEMHQLDTDIGYRSDSNPI